MFGARREQLIVGRSVALGGRSTRWSDPESSIGSTFSAKEVSLNRGSLILAIRVITLSFLVGIASTTSALSAPDAGDAYQLVLMEGETISFNGTVLPTLAVNSSLALRLAFSVNGEASTQYITTPSWSYAAPADGTTVEIFAEVWRDGSFSSYWTPSTTDNPSPFAAPLEIAHPSEFNYNLLFVPDTTTKTSCGLGTAGSGTAAGAEDGAGAGTVVGEGTGPCDLTPRSIDLRVTRRAVFLIYGLLSEKYVTDTNSAGVFISYVNQFSDYISDNGLSNYDMTLIHIPSRLRRSFYLTAGQINVAIKDLVFREDPVSGALVQVYSDVFVVTHCISSTVLQTAILQAQGIYPADKSVDVNSRLDGNGLPVSADPLLAALYQHSVHHISISPMLGGIELAVESDHRGLGVALGRLVPQMDPVGDFQTWLKRQFPHVVDHLKEYYTFVTVGDEMLQGVWNHYRGVTTPGVPNRGNPQHVWERGVAWSSIYQVERAQGSVSWGPPHVEYMDPLEPPYPILSAPPTPGPTEPMDLAQLDVGSAWILDPAFTRIVWDEVNPSTHYVSSLHDLDTKQDRPHATLTTIPSSFKTTGKHPFAGHRILLVYLPLVQRVGNIVFGSRYGQYLSETHLWTTAAPPSNHESSTTSLPPADYTIPNSPIIEVFLPN